MKKHIPKLSLLALAYLSVIFQAHTQNVPQGINYQAIARDASGEVLGNQSIHVKMVVLDGLANGTAVYEETHQDTTNAFGSFTLVIGQGSPLTGPFDDVDWSSGTKFLQVSIDPEGGNNFIEMGTTPLLSVPYALYAAKSGDTPPPQTLHAGKGIVIASDSLINTGDTDASDDLTVTSEAEGDVRGKFSALRVEQLQGTKLSIPDSVGTGSVLKWDGAQWKPDADNDTPSFWARPDSQNLSYPGDVLIGGATDHFDGPAESFAIRGKSKEWYLGVENKEDEFGVDSGFFISQADSSDGTFHIFENGMLLVPRLHIKQPSSTGLILQNEELGRGWLLGTRDNGKLVFGEGTFSDAGSSTTFTRLAITQDGKVGIGPFNLDNPTHELHMVHASTGGGGATAGLKIENEGSNHNWWAFYTTNSSGELELYYKGSIRGEFDPADGEYRQRSDGRLKRSVTPLSPTLEKVLRLQPSTYYFKDDENPTTPSLGFIAQEVQPLFPELVGYAGEEQDIMTLNYNGFSVLAIKAIQEQQALIKALTEEVATLKKELTTLKNQLP